MTITSRRRVIKSAGCLIVGMASPAFAASSTASVSPVMARLSSYMAQARNQDLPAEVIEKAKTTY